MSLNKDQLERYKRHIVLSGVGDNGQEKIISGRLLIIGMGGLGSSAGLYLSAAGVGTIGIVDTDNVDLTNLHRQIIHTNSDIGIPKVLSAKAKMNAINPDVRVITYRERVSAKNILEIIKDYDFVIDCTDNFTAKFLINDACMFSKKPFSHGEVLRFSGQTMTCIPGTACYRCVFAAAPVKGAVPSGSQAGILGSVPGMLGTIQATEALKYLIGTGELLTNRLLIFNALNMEFREVLVSKNQNCPICGRNPIITKLLDEV